MTRRHVTVSLHPWLQQQLAPARPSSQCARKARISVAIARLSAAAGDRNGDISRPRAGRSALGVPRRAATRALGSRVAESVRSQQSGRCRRGCCSCACYAGVVANGGGRRSWRRWSTGSLGRDGPSWPRRSAWPVAFDSHWQLSLPRRHTSEFSAGCGGPRRDETAVLVLCGSGRSFKVAVDRAPS